MPNNETNGLNYRVVYRAKDITNDPAFWVPYPTYDTFYDTLPEARATQMRLEETRQDVDTKIQFKPIPVAWQDLEGGS